MMGNAGSVHDLTKAYGGELALTGVDLAVGAGEVHGLVGPNGAGKSTLIGCLGGAVRPDRGTITIGDVTVDHLDPLQARRLGAAVIYQHFSLAANLTVSDNIFLGTEITRAGLINRKAQRDRARELIGSFGLDLDPDALVARMTPGQRQLVEISKALAHEPRLLILDEPTSALGVAETESLLRHVRLLADRGLGILFVSHLLDDVLRVSDEITVLRNGSVHSAGPRSTFTKSSLIEAISPNSVATTGHRTAARQIGISLRGVELPPAVGPIDLDVHAGEIVGIFGLLGCGASELLQGIFGTRAMARGTMELAGRPYAPRGPRQALAAGVALVPADRSSDGIFAGLPASENILMPHLGTIGRWGVVRRPAAERRAFASASKGLRLDPPRDMPIAAYSGGNQQKVLLGRWLNHLSAASVLLLDQPTQGVDIGARHEIYRLLREHVSEGDRCVLFCGTEYEEMAALADRVLVLHGGVAQGIRTHTELDAEKELLHLAHGQQRPAVPADAGGSR